MLFIASFCLLFRFVLQGLIIKTKFFGHLSCGRWVNEMSFLFWWMGGGWESSLSLSGRQHSLTQLTFLCYRWFESPSEQNQMPALALVSHRGHWQQHWRGLGPGGRPSGGAMRKVGRKTHPLSGIRMAHDLFPLGPEVLLLLKQLVVELLIWWWKPTFVRIECNYS